MEKVTDATPVVLAKCKNCATKGERETFYSNNKRFCTKRCARSYSKRRSSNDKKLQRPSLDLLRAPSEHRNNFADRPKQSSHNKEKDRVLLLPSDARKVKELTNNFQWGNYLDSTGSKAAPVSCFTHAPLKDLFSSIDTRFKIEVPNIDIPVSAKVYWIAKIVKVAGYKVKFRYLGMGGDNSLDVWANLGEDVKWVGWSALRQISFCCPLTCNKSQSNWKGFLFEKILNCHTLPPSYSDDITNGLKCPVKKNMRVEIVDKQQLSQNRIGIVDQIVAGRLRIRYEDGNNPDDFFWCHSKSSVVHPIGWSETVGHDLKVKDELKGNYHKVPDFQNAGSELLYQPPVVDNDEQFLEGMKLEAVDPLDLSTICVATVVKTLKEGYLMISVDGVDSNENNHFCHHRTSATIFPAGFCKVNNIKLTPPAGWTKRKFDWKQYLIEQNAPAAPATLFAPSKKTHTFCEGMKLEAVDLVFAPRLIYVATVSRVIGNVLRIHFDGWEDDYDQWIDATSPNIFPVGWCELVGHVLQPPNDEPSKKECCFDDSDVPIKRRKRKRKPDEFSIQQNFSCC